MRNQFLACLTLLFALQSCSVLTTLDTPSQSVEPLAAGANKTLDLLSTPSDSFGQFSSDVLYMLLTAEIAASRQRYDITLEQYIKAAETTGDLGIIARATRLAQYFRNSQQTLYMAGLWLTQAPDSVEAHTIITSMHLENRQPLKALDSAERILTILTQAVSTSGAVVSQTDSEKFQLQQDAGENPDDSYANTRTPSIKQRAAILETIANFSRTTDADTREKLIERFHLLDSRYPALTPIKVALSVLYESGKDTEKAFSIVRMAIAADADYLPAARQEINLLNADGAFALALEKLNVQLGKTPNNARIRLLYARTLAQTDINAAYEEFTLLSESAPDNLDIKFSKAIIALELRKLSDAKQILTELLSDQYRPNTINYYLGNLFELQEDPTTAINYYLAVKDGNDFVAANSQAARLMVDLGKLEDALSHLQTLRDKSPSSRAQWFNAEADILDDESMTQAAIDVLDVAIAEFPNNVSLLYKRSSLYEKTDRLTLMEADLRHALGLEPNNSAILNALGYFLTIRTERYQEAFELINAALLIKPDDPAILDSMGWVLFKLARLDEAITYLRKAFEQYPDPEVAAHLGEALWAKGSRQEALGIWNKTLAENPDDTIIPETKRRLNAQQ